MASYGTVDRAAALVPSMGMPGAATTPTSTQITSWLEEGAAVINRYIASAGYSVPVASTAALYAELVGLNSLYAAALIVAARGIDTASGGEEDRSELWLDRFYGQLAALAQSNLAALGATVVLSSESAARRRPRLRSLQVRRVDGYAGAHVQSRAAYDNVSE